MTTKRIIYSSVKIISTLFTVCLLAVCLFLGFLFYCNIVKMPVPTLGPFRIYVVLSDSMLPVIHMNDAIIVMDTDPAKLEVDDVIAFYAFEGDVAITHRIIQKEQTSDGYEFNTKGDNNNVADNFVTPGSRIIGKNILTIPQFGSFLSNLEKQPFIIIIPVFVVLIIQFLLGLLEKKFKPGKKVLAIEADLMTAEIPEQAKQAQPEPSGYREGSGLEDEVESKNK